MQLMLLIRSLTTLRHRNWHRQNRRLLVSKLLCLFLGQCLGQDCFIFCCRSDIIASLQSTLLYLRLTFSVIACNMPETSLPDMYLGRCLSSSVKMSPSSVRSFNMHPRSKLWQMLSQNPAPYCSCYVLHFHMNAPKFDVCSSIRARLGNIGQARLMLSCTSTPVRSLECAIKHCWFVATYDKSCKKCNNNEQN